MLVDVKPLKGRLSNVQPLKGKLNKDIQYVNPVTQEKATTPTKEQQVLTPDEGFTGLSKVTIDAIPDTYTEVSGEIDITTNGEYDVKSYEKAKVSVEMPKIYNARNLFFNNARTEYITEFCSMIDESCTMFRDMFYSAGSLIEVPNNFSTSNGTTFNAMYRGCTNLTTIPEMDCGKATDITNMLMSCSKLTTLGGFKDLGKAYKTTYSANYSSYKLDLSYANSLTHESLMNVINGLYDIATNGCNTQQLKLGSTNLAKLTAEEIAIATNKGWTVQ